MPMQYVELITARDIGTTHPRHVVKHVSNAKTKHGRQVLTVCGEALVTDDVTIFAARSSQIGDRPPGPICKECCGETDHAPMFDGKEPGPPSDAVNKCDSEPPSNGHSNQACTLPNRHSHAHQNGKISWSGAPGVWKPIEVIYSTPDGKRPNGAQAVGKSKRLAAQGVDALLAPTPAPLRLEQLDVDDIERSPLNHRTRFDGIDELGVDIKTNGLRVPIKVRPMPADANHKGKAAKPWQLVYGERRWRAAKAAGVKTLPALISELTDLEVIKEQLVENVSRSDVHPLEEADGYQALLEQHGYDVDQIAKETGKSRTAIYNRLKLRALPASARVEFFAGRLSASVAELIARIPVEALREEATRDILRGRVQDRYELSETLDRIAEEVAEDLEEESAESYLERVQPRAGLQVEAEDAAPLTTREASALIKRRYMLRLELAPFDLTDASLPGGACTLCVHRTGNQRDLFGDVASADVCTNPPCFETKRAEATQKKIQATKAAGLDVLPETKAEQIFSSDGSQNYSSPYLDLDDEASWEYQEVTGQTKHHSPVRTEKTWRQVLAEAAPPPTVAIDNRGHAHELVEKKIALASLDKAGRLPKAVQQSREGRASSSDRERKEREKHDLKVDTAARVIAGIVDNGDGIASTEIARWLAEAAIRQASMEAHALVVRRRELAITGERHGRAANENALLKLAKNLKTQALLECLVIELLASENAAARYQIGFGTNLTAAAKPFKFDLAKVKKSVEAARRISKEQAKVNKAVAKILKSSPAKKGRKS